jgi:hypothetical protein
MIPASRGPTPMSLILKSIAAFGIGVGAVAGVQNLWVSSVTGHMRSDAFRAASRLPDMKPVNIPKFDASRLGVFTSPKLDPKIGQDAWRGTLNRQIDQSIRAGNMVPRIHRPAGMPRY